MNIFITGATGFIGAKLAMKLADEGNQVHAIYRSQKKIESLQHQNIKWFEGDIMNRQSIELAMQGCEQVYHIAAHAVAWEQNPGDFIKFNVQGTINVLDAAKNIGVKKIVVTSTAGVFGPSLNSVITEKTISSLPHFTGYERSKAESERIIAARVVEKGENIVIVCPTRVFGPGALNESNSVTILIKKYISGKWHFNLGNGSSIGNYVFVNDVVNGHIFAMKKGRAGEKYILGGDNISYNQFFSIIGKLSGKHFKLTNIPLAILIMAGNVLLILNKLFNITPAFTPAHIRKFNYHWQVSCDKAISELGYSYTPIEKALEETINWLNQSK